MRLLGRVFLLVLALAIAIPFGLLALLIGILLEPTARDLAGTVGLATVWTIFSDLAHGDAPDAKALALLTAVGTGLFAILVAPPTLVALIGEGVGWRSVLWYAGGSGLMTALLPWLLRARSGAARFAEAALPAEGRISALLFLTGAATGLVYWAIAGRSAGRSPPTSAAGGSNENRRPA